MDSSSSSSLLQSSSDSGSNKQYEHNNMYDSINFSSSIHHNTPLASPAQSTEITNTNEINDNHSNNSNSHNNNSNNPHHDSMPFFNETLDLSQEDIQKTLSANMPLGGVHGHSHPHHSEHQQHHHHSINDDAMNGDINPMDFIDNCGDTHENVDDDVFVNLDAFDMLVEFPELELDAKNSFLHSGNDAHDISHHYMKHNEGALNDLAHHELSTITDFSPEWAYPEGGIKVLVTGPWNSASSYTVLFDSFPVPTTLVQSGVLRCYCPGEFFIKI